MKLHRSLAVTAVTAFVSSAALYAAPAFAAETPSASPSATASSSSAPHDESPAPKTTSTATSTATATSAPSKQADPTTQGDGSAQQVTIPGLPSDQNNGPQLSYVGLPGHFTAGAAAVQFDAVIKNTTGQDLAFIPAAALGSADNSLSASQVTLQYQASDGTWKTVQLEQTTQDGVKVIAGFFGVDTDAAGHPMPRLLKAGANVSVPMRISFSKDANVPKGVALMAGFALDQQEQQYTSLSDAYLFSVTPGAPVNPGVPLSYVPNPPAKVVLPAAGGGAQLAHTGGNTSMATTIGVVGGVALVGGAGLLVVMRRRKGTAAV